MLALSPAAMFAVLMILAITTIAGALRSDIRGGSGLPSAFGLSEITDHFSGLMHAIMCVHSILSHGSGRR